MSQYIPRQMDTYFIVFLMKGTTWTADETAELKLLQEAHLEYLYRLGQSGVLVLNGPLTDNGQVRGLSVYKTETLEQARALAEADPAVRASRFSVEVHPWLVAAGILP
jgi:uncharacterized protein